MSYIIKTILEWYHELNYENFCKYMDARKIIRDGKPENAAEKNAIFWVSQIAEHHVSLEYEVTVKA